MSYISESNRAKLEARANRPIRYTNSEFGISMLLPSSFSYQEEETAPGITNVVLNSPEGMRINLILMVNPEEKDLDEAVEENVEQMIQLSRQELGGQTDIKQVDTVKDVKIGEERGKQVTLMSDQTIIPGPGNVPISVQFRFCYIYTNVNRHSYLFRIICISPEEFDGCMGYFQKILPEVEFSTPVVKVRPVTAVVYDEYYNEQLSMLCRIPQDWKPIQKETDGSASTLPGENVTVASASRLLDFEWSSDEVDMHLQVMIVIEQLPSTCDLDDYYQLSKVQLQKGLIPLLAVKCKNKVLSGHPGKELIYSPSNHVKITKRFSVFNGKAYIVACEATNTQDLQPEPVIERFLNSIQFNVTPSSVPANFGKNSYYEHLQARISISFPRSFKFSGDIGYGFGLSITNEKQYPGVEVGLFFQKCVMPFSEMVQSLRMSFEQFGIQTQSMDKKKVLNTDGYELVQAGQFPQLDGQLPVPKRKVCRLCAIGDNFYSIHFLAPLENFNDLWDTVGKPILESTSLLPPTN